MSTQANKNGVKIEFGTIKVDKVEPHLYKKGVSQAQIRQTVTKTYPSMRIGSSKADSLFGESAFDLEAGKAYTQERVTWIIVPTGATVESVAAELAKYPNARIKREIANDVAMILTDEQLNAIDSPELDYSIEKASERFIVKDSEGNIVQPVQYAQNFFVTSAKPDVDYRTVTATSVETAAEANANEILNM